MWPVLDDARANAAARGTRYQPNFLRVFFDFILGWNQWAVAITGVLVLAGVAVLARQWWRAAIAACSAALVVVSAILFVWGVLQPYDLYGRFFVSIVPFIAMLAGLGITAMHRIPAGAVGFALCLALVPGARDELNSSTPLRDAAALADRARTAGYGVCGGWGTEALVVYTAPVRYSNGSPDDNCDMLISVFRLTPEQIATVTATYGGRVTLGGATTLWAPVEILEELGFAS